MDYLRLEVVALWLIYAAAATAAVWLARRFAGPLSSRAGVFLAAAPLVFTGAAMFSGGIYGPADLYYGHDPWRRVAAAHGVTGIANPILSDLAFANLKCDDLMTHNPIVTAPEMLAFEALRLMEDRPSQINVLPVVDGDSKCVGLIRLHDIVRTGL